TLSLHDALPICLVAAGEAHAKVFLSQDEALALAFPGAHVTRKTAFLTEAERDEVARVSGGSKPSALSTYYIAEKDGATLGMAYFDVHRVRTQNEVLMIVVK